MSKRAILKRLAAVMTASVMLLSTNPTMGLEVSYDGGDTDFSLSGSLDEKKAGQIVTLKVTDKDNNIIHTRQTFTDANGAYKFVFSLDYDGQATVTVSDNLEKETIYKSTPEEVTAALNRLAGDESTETVISEEADVLQVDLEEYTSLSESGLMNKFLDSQTITSVADFKRAYNLAKFLVTVQGSTASEVVETENTYPDVKEATASAIGQIYAGLAETSRVEIVGSLVGTTYEDIASYVEARDLATVIFQINAEQNHNAKYKLIKDNNNILGLDLDTYEKLDDKFDLFKDKLFENSFDDIADLKDKAKKAYEAASYDDEEESSSGKKSSNVSVGGGYTQQTPVKPLEQFTDLAGYDWARTPVTLLASKGVINGKSDGIFAPADNVTRAEFVKMLALAFDISGEAGIKFTDVPAGHWAYDYICALTANGIVTGISEDEFGTSMQITRQDMAVLCGRVMDMKKVSAEGEQVVFDDADTISAYAKDGVDKLSKTGVINGTGDGSFAPRKFATRAEAAVIIYRLQEYFSGR